LRPLLERSDFGAGLANGESDPGGFDEFRLFCPNCRLNSATSAQQLDLLGLPHQERRESLIGRVSIGGNHAMIDNAKQKDQLAMPQET
jgi:hypothetical protein